MKTPGCTRRHSKKPPELRMTPMIDIVFNLIIFFILTQSFKATEGYLPTNLPAEAGCVIQPPGCRLNGYRIDLDAVGQDGSVDLWLNGVRMSDFRELRRQLIAAADVLSPGQRNDVTVVISPTTGTWHKHVVAAFDAAIAARLPNIAFTVPQ